MNKENNKNITKLYIFSNKHKLLEKDIIYLVSLNRCYPLSVRKINTDNWIAEIEYQTYTNLLSLLETTEVRNKQISIKRIFKSMRLSKQFMKEPSKGFLLRVAMGISGLIKNPLNIRVTNNKANDWQKELLRIWQNEIDNPSKFKQAGINNVIDILPKGEVEFCIVKVGGYIVTFFNKSIDEYIKNE